MSKLPGFMFYPGDWLKDPAIRSVSRSARGLWIDMLCLMFECEPRGYLKINGKVPTDNQLSLMLSCPQPELEQLIDELRQAGVLSESKDRCIFSRRLVRDDEIRKKRSVSGALGGNPAFVKGSSNPYYKGKDKQNDKPEHNQRDKLPDKQNTEYENENEFGSSLKSSRKKPTLLEIQTYCVQLKLTQQDAEWVFDKWEGSGWKNNGRAIADWKATIRSWHKISIFPSQRQNGNHKQNGRPSRDPAKSNNDMACICCKKSFVEAALGGYQRPCKCDPMSWCEEHMRCRICCGCPADIPPTGVTKGDAKASGSNESGRIRPV